MLGTVLRDRDSGLKKTENTKYKNSSMNEKGHYIYNHTCENWTQIKFLTMKVIFGILYTH